jgi:hypothetical protein
MEKVDDQAAGPLDDLEGVVDLEIITMSLAGSILAWVTNPTRQPDRRPSAAAVTMNIG